MRGEPVGDMRPSGLPDPLRTGLKTPVPANHRRRPRSRPRSPLKNRGRGRARRRGGISPHPLLAGTIQMKWGTTHAKSAQDAKRIGIFRVPSNPPNGAPVWPPPTARLGLPSRPARPLREYPAASFRLKRERQPRGRAGFVGVQPSGCPGLPQGKSGTSLYRFIGPVTYNSSQNDCWKRNPLTRPISHPLPFGRGAGRGEGLPLRSEFSPFFLQYALNRRFGNEPSAGAERHENPPSESEFPPFRRPRGIEILLGNFKLNVSQLISPGAPE